MSLRDEEGEEGERKKERRETDKSRERE